GAAGRGASGLVCARAVVWIGAHAQHDWQRQRDDLDHGAFRFLGALDFALDCDFTFARRASNSIGFELDSVGWPVVGSVNWASCVESGIAKAALLSLERSTRYFPCASPVTVK